MRKINQIGIILEELSASQLSYFAIKNVNEYIEDSLDDFVIFFENITGTVIQPEFATMAINEIWSFNGTAVATSVSTALSLLKSHSVTKKYFYVWDLEWSRRHGRDYDYISAAYINPEIKLIARSKDHATAIENYCNRKVSGIVPNFNITKLMDIINHE
ncbi:hypothetical protein CL634_08060 [bacterium]|nr:hypothetical protein [bacterium]|tara:strand:- start:84 stop:560 length:477 start_codon:yes stop_codon:yes gene_type:complete